MTAKDTTVRMGASQVRSAAPVGSANRQAWRFVGLFGVALAVIGFGQLLLNFFPVLGFGSPEWEFATMAVMIGGLPLGTMGLAAAGAAAVALGNRTGTIFMAIVLILLVLAVGAAVGLFLTVVPLALQASPAASAGIRQSIAKTLWMGTGFGLLYLTAAVGMLRHLKRSARRPNA